MPVCLGWRKADFLKSTHNRISPTSLEEGEILYNADQLQTGIFTISKLNRPFTPKNGTFHDQVVALFLVLLVAECQIVRKCSN